MSKGVDVFFLGGCVRWGVGASPYISYWPYCAPRVRNVK